jgi:hypothetical protein
MHGIGMELVQTRDESTAGEFAGTRPDLTATLYDGRRVVGRQRDRGVDD